MHLVKIEAPSEAHNDVWINRDLVSLVAASEDNDGCCDIYLECEERPVLAKGTLSEVVALLRNAA